MHAFGNLGRKYTCIQNLICYFFERVAIWQKKNSNGHAIGSKYNTFCAPWEITGNKRFFEFNLNSVDFRTSKKNVQVS